MKIAYFTAVHRTSILDIERKLEGRSVEPLFAGVNGYIRYLSEHATHHNAVDEPWPTGLGFPASQAFSN